MEPSDDAARGPQSESTPTADRRQKRIRKSRSRGLRTKTGCLTCRQRHVSVVVLRYQCSGHTPMLVLVRLFLASHGDGKSEQLELMGGIVVALNRRLTCVRKQKKCDEKGD